jgi:hypothetical protein
MIFQNEQPNSKPFLFHIVIYLSYVNKNFFRQFRPGLIIGLVEYGFSLDHK